MKHIAQVLEELRRYIAGKEDRADLEEIDSLLSVALSEVRRKLARQRLGQKPSNRASRQRMKGSI
jgi:hypothetical protein